MAEDNAAERSAAERIAETDEQRVDGPFISRLLLGALAEHEQRLLAIRLLRRDTTFRAAVAAVLEPFEMFDLDLAAEYDQALKHEGDAGEARRLILARAFDRAPDLERLPHELTYADVLELGQVTRRLFTWSMAEHLLERSQRAGQSEYHVRTSLYLASTVIDVVEILGASGRAPEYPDVVRDVRRRISAASTSRGSRQQGA